MVAKVVEQMQRPRLRILIIIRVRKKSRHCAIWHTCTKYDWDMTTMPTFVLRPTRRSLPHERISPRHGTNYSYYDNHHHHHHHPATSRTTRTTTLAAATTTTTTTTLLIVMVMKNIIMLVVVVGRWGWHIVQHTVIAVSCSCRSNEMGTIVVLPTMINYHHASHSTKTTKQSHRSGTFSTRSHVGG